MIQLDELPSEVLADIFLHCSSVPDVFHLAASCHRLKDVLASRRLRILSTVTDTQYGPLQDAIQLVTHNASQPAHVARQVPLSLALLKQVVQAGRIAKEWEEIYPTKKWKGDTVADRRLLSNQERQLLRRAIYRLWLYSRAFHNQSHTRYARLSRPVVQERQELLHNWSNLELGEIADVRQVIRDVLRNNLCPSDGTIARKFRKRFPEAPNHHLALNVHLNYPAQPTFLASHHGQHYHSHLWSLQQQQQQQQQQYQRPASPFHQNRLPETTPASYKLQATRLRDPGMEGWGDDIAHYYVIEDMLKLDPQQVVWLLENAPTKGDVECYVMGLGEWFNNNGDTFGQTVESVVAERGGDVDEWLDAVADGSLGITRAAL